MKIGMSEMCKLQKFTAFYLLTPKSCKNTWDLTALSFKLRVPLPP